MYFTAFRRSTNSRIFALPPSLIDNPAHGFNKGYNGSDFQHEIKDHEMYTIHEEQIIDTSLQEAWDFISNPRNLNAITPGHGF